MSARADEPAPTAWKLVWSDEFNGDAIDRSHWDFDTGNGFYNYDSKTWIAGWGNDELQYYTRDPDNAFVRDGMLHIVALKEVARRLRLHLRAAQDTSKEWRCVVP